MVTYGTIDMVTSIVATTMVWYGTIDATKRFTKGIVQPAMLCYAIQAHKPR